VRDLAEARAFYGGLLGCAEGRSSDAWVDFDLGGHQIVAHLAPHDPSNARSAGPEAGTSRVDGEDVPHRHFGLILERAEWDALAAKLEANGVRFLIPPTVRFRGQPGEQATMFFEDPSGNALEFKSFADDDQVFKKE
jgi:extradiol dioxygenase family protein